MIRTVEGVTLRAEDLGESDKRVTFYTKELGKLKAKVVGTKKTSSKLRVFTFPFAESRLQVYLHGSERTDLRIPGRIIGGEILDSHSILRSDWERMIQSSAICETLDVLTYPLYTNPREYSLLTSTLKDMESSPQPSLVRHRSTLILLSVLGYGIRHHPFWKSFPKEEKDLLRKLANWDRKLKIFSIEETRILERITDSYLSLYLPSPLKTGIFLTKISADKTPASV